MSTELNEFLIVKILLYMLEPSVSLFQLATVQYRDHLLFV